MKTDHSNTELEAGSEICQPVEATVPDAPEIEPDDPRVMAAVRHFRIVVRSIQAHSAWVERQCGLSAAQLWALWEVARAPGLNVSQIARRLSIKPATASNLLDKIENKGLLERARSGPDQRVVKLFVTRSGEKLLATAPLPAQGALLDGLTRLADGELEGLNKGLEALVEILSIKDEGSAMAPMPPGKS
ncbi:MarR family transcriptional regulator [Wenzhouxiangella sp. AB-CW3]|uniref:MarR family winged helix-turn-helix transcriptional regulator n=1 Tax=Wenzhouxiangella sp. AB-CW3 TaxID=2771012 RepID=UPI00168B4EB7|nr:MarR family transcriptional regulator [Wenzhouxiangella sp. AB-CW3]QOC22311.1 MarR family transcriptional regulator [Wenzhouxiangella sp. AB-CW3]